MALEIGGIYEGKVSHVTKFGAFVSLPEGKSGLVHISEIANTYISDINEHIHVGDEVKVKLLSIAPDGKIALSVKKALPAPEPQERKPFTPRPRPAERSENTEARAPQLAAGPTDDKDFESKLKKFMQDSDSRIADNRLYADRNRKNRRR